MKGTPRYTQHTVAWPRLPIHEPNCVEELGVSFDAKGGGTHGEFMFRWYRFSSYSYRDRTPSLRAEVFSDGLGAFLDPRIQRVVGVLQRRHAAGQPDATPDFLIALLESEGVKPSDYHKAGLAAR